MGDKIQFSRERYRLGHTLVFFRAGALAFLGENRDDIVLKLLRMLQGQVYKHVKRREFAKKRDQRELIKVCQRNFRKYMQLRDWGWYVIIQKTRPLIGQVNIEEELRKLEEQANDAYGAYQDQLDTKARLEVENVNVKEESKLLLKQIESEQGNLGEYTERQAKAAAAKADMEFQLTDAQDKLGKMEIQRQNATSNKKQLELDNGEIKKEIQEFDIAIQKLEQEKTNRDHNIRSLNDEIAGQDEIINKLNKENNAKASEDLQAAEDKVDHLSNIKARLE